MGICLVVLQVSTPIHSNQTNDGKWKKAVLANGRSFKVFSSSETAAICLLVGPSVSPIATKFNNYSKVIKF